MDRRHLVRLAPGETIDHFALERLLGRGSYAEVWLAEDRERPPGSRCALKVLRTDEAADEDVQSFLDEARICAAFDHRNIVAVHEIRRLGNLVYLAMEFVEGGNLADLMDRSHDLGIPLPHGAIVNMGLQLAAGLEHAHRARDAFGADLNIIHRDLKPANVLLTERGDVKISDFGLAKAAGNVGETTAGMIKGTPAYVAPESWEGERDFQPAVDLFSVGCILWEAVMLRRLYDGASIPLVYRQLLDRTGAEEAAEVAGRFPEFVPILEGLLCRDPQDRYATAGDLTLDLLALRSTLHEPETLLDHFGALLDAEADPSYVPPVETDPMPKPQVSAKIDELRPIEEEVETIETKPPPLPSSEELRRTAEAIAEGDGGAVTVSTEIPPSPDDPSGPLDDDEEDAPTVEAPLAEAQRSLQEVRASGEIRSAGDVVQQASPPSQPVAESSGLPTWLLVVLVLLALLAVLWLGSGDGSPLPASPGDIIQP